MSPPGVRVRAVFIRNNVKCKMQSFIDRNDLSNHLNCHKPHTKTLKKFIYSLLAALAWLAQQSGSAQTSYLYIFTVLKRYFMTGSSNLVTHTF